LKFGNIIQVVKTEELIATILERVNDGTRRYFNFKIMPRNRDELDQLINSVEQSMIQSARLRRESL
ncbi:hypothetical protein, partial [Klebsiella pneumoniae]|uniref:hypothetical protein n=1 Tax=Klebsiella pneumoniae TaxID=573 RepID=UPI00405591DC